MKMLLTPQAAADYIGVSLATLYRLANQRRIPTVHVGRLLRIPMEGLERWIDANTTAPIPLSRNDPQGRHRPGLTGNVISLEPARRGRKAS
ncbi:MAG TPA: helix-turn-helix domain-containing protein [Candidatus Xenobia bacterium]|jgi:excisionase family DNA binding protein